MTIVIYDTPLSRQQFYPFSITRPLAGLHYGCMSVKQRWQTLLQMPVFALSLSGLSDEIPAATDFYVCVDATVNPSVELVDALHLLQPGEQIIDATGMVAYATTSIPQFGQTPIWPASTVSTLEAQRFTHASELLHYNAAQIQNDLQLLRSNFEHTDSVEHATVYGHKLYKSPGATLRGVIINTLEGPVIIDEGALIMEGTCIRGPVYIGQHAVIKMGTMLYGGTSIFNKCTVGGEVKQAILYPFSNKAHHGYLGDSIVGSWCNLGAGTSNSNIKNTAGTVFLYDDAVKGFRKAGNKAGLFMGDYSRCAVNTRFNTGTTVGVCCSLHTDTVPPSHVLSFTFGISETYKLPEALRHINAWMQLKGESLQHRQQQTLEEAFKMHAASFNA